MVRYKSNVMGQCLTHSKPLINMYWTRFSSFIICIRKGGGHESELMTEVGLVPSHFPTQSSSTIPHFGYVSTSQSFMWLVCISIYRINLKYCFLVAQFLNKSLARIQIGVVQSLSRVRLFMTPWTAACQDCPSFTISWSCSNSCPLSRWCDPTISSSVAPFFFCLQSFPASGSFPNELALHIRWPKYWSFSFSISPSNEYSGLISFRIDRFDIIDVWGMLETLL